MDNNLPRKITDKDKEYKLTSMEDTRFLHCNIKTLNLIPSVVAYQHAKENNCDETVFHRGDIVTECAHSNVHIIKDKNSSLILLMNIFYLVLLGHIY